MPQPVCFGWVDPANNTLRLYAPAIERNLLGKLCLITEYCRFGRSGRVIFRLRVTEREVLDLFTLTSHQNERRGYTH
jgi:hypothetical protein